jgi:hypothetical protein
LPDLLVFERFGDVRVEIERVARGETDAAEDAEGVIVEGFTRGKRGADEAGGEVGETLGVG